MLSVFSCPSRYTQGRDATARLGAEMRTLGLEGPALVVAWTPSVIARAPVRFLVAGMGDALVAADALGRAYR